MTKTTKAVTLLTLLTSLTACDYVQQKELRDDRTDDLYRAAMKDYEAGRVEAAEAGFEKTVRADPANASARFQLACLLQDRRHDYLGALCNYREYVLQVPDSEKTELAKERAALCEKALALEMVKKLNQADGVASAKALAVAQETAESLQKRLAETEKQLAEVTSRNETLRTENVRLRRMIATVGEDSETSRMKVSDIKDVLDDLEEDRLRLSPDAKAIFDEEEQADASAVAAGARKAVSGLEDDGPALLDHRDGKAPEGRRLTDLVSGAGLGASSRPAVEPPHEERPEFYVVEENDTLYRIAMRFYGRRDAWRKIQQANKAIISNDGNIRAGQRIRLP